MVLLVLLRDVQHEMDIGTIYELEDKEVVGVKCQGVFSPSVDRARLYKEHSSKLGGSSCPICF